VIRLVLATKTAFHCEKCGLFQKEEWTLLEKLLSLCLVQKVISIQVVAKMLQNSRFFFQFATRE